MMAGYQKTPFKGKNRIKRVVFNGFTLLDGEEKKMVGLNVLNCDCRGGRLRRGIGAAPYYGENGEEVFTYLEEELAGVYPLAVNINGNNDHEGLALVGENGYVYWVDMATFEATERVFIGEYPRYYTLRTHERRAYHFFVGKQAAYVTLDGVTFTKIVETGDVRGGCAAGGRFFLMENAGKITYSAAFQPTKWAGASNDCGGLFLPPDAGDSVGIETEGNDVYFFTRRAIFRLTVKAEATDFAIERLAYVGGEICPRSPIHSGTGIFFLAVDGLYCVREKKVEKVNFEVKYMPKRGGACWVGRCPNTVLMEYADEEGVLRRMALSADGKDGFYVDRNGFLGGNECFCKNGALMRFVRGGERATYARVPYFESVALNFGSEKRKVLRQIRIKGKKEVKITVLSEGNSHTYTILCKQGEGKVRVCDNGNSFIFRLTPDLDGIVEGMEVEYLCYEE